MEEDYLPEPMSLKWRLGLCLLFFGPAVYFKLDGDMITAAVCVVAGISAFGGYRAGAASILALFAAFAAAIAYGPSVGLAYEWKFRDWFGTTGLTNRFVSVAVVAAIIALVIVVLSFFLLRKVMRSSPRLAQLNSWAGLGVGAIEGVVAAALFLGGLLMIEPLEQQRHALRDENDVRGQMVSKFILTTTSQTRESHLGPALENYNPFTRIPSLNKLEEIQQSVRVLSEPGKVEELLEYPTIKELQESPAMRRVVEELRTDPELSEILGSNEPVSVDKIRTLMDHPAILELVDQPGFLEEASKAIREAARDSEPNRT